MSCWQRASTASKPPWSASTSWTRTCLQAVKSGDTLMFPFTVPPAVILDHVQPLPQEGAAQPDSSPGAALHRPTVHESHLGRAANDLHPSAHVRTLPRANVSTDARTLGTSTPTITHLHGSQVAALGGKRGNISLHGRRQVHAALHQECRTEDLQRPRQLILTPGVRFAVISRYQRLPPYI